MRILHYRLKTTYVFFAVFTQPLFNKSIYLIPSVLIKIDIHSEMYSYFLTIEY